MSVRTMGNYNTQGTSWFQVGTSNSARGDPAISVERLCREHWMTITKFWPKPTPKLFLWYHIFRNRNWDSFQRPNFLKPKPILFSETKFSETETKTFFPRPKSPKPIPKPSKKWQKSRNRNRDFSISRQIFGEIVSKYFPPFPSLFLFSSRKNIARIANAVQVTICLLVSTSVY